MGNRNRKIFDKKEAAKEIYEIFKNYGSADINLEDYTPKKNEELDAQTFYNLYNRAQKRMTNYICILYWVKKRQNIDIKRVEETLYYSSDEALEDVGESIRCYYDAYEENRRLNSFEEIDSSLKMDTDNKVDSLLITESKNKAYSPSDTPYFDEAKEEILTPEELAAMGYCDTAEGVSKRYCCNIVTSDY